MGTEIQQNRYDQLMRRVGGLIGPGAKVAEVLSELFPVLDVERVPGELLALAGWRLAWGTSERPGVAGVTSGVQLFNPVGSGIIATVSQVEIRTDLDTLINVGLDFTPIGGTPIHGVFRDARFGGARETTLLTSTNVGYVVTAGLTYRAEALISNTWKDDNGVAVLIPGSGLGVATQQFNIGLIVSYFWRERVAEPSELNL